MKININGIDTELRFTMRQIERMDELNKEGKGSLLLGSSVNLIFSSLETHYRLVKQDNPFTKNDIELWVDEHTETAEGDAVLKSISEAYMNSYVFKQLMADAATVEAEKKRLLNGKTSEPLPSESLV